MLGQLDPVGAARLRSRTTPSPVRARGAASPTSLLTEEAQLAGTLFDEQLDFVTGIYYSSEDPDGFNALGSFNAGSYNPSTSAEIETTSKAIYAQGVASEHHFESLEKFNLTLGVRRTDDEEEGARFAT